MKNQSPAILCAAAEPWRLRLYVAGSSPSSARAIVHLNRIKAEYLPPRSRIEVIDLLAQTEAAELDEIMAIPTLVRVEPQPARRIIGDLSDLERVLLCLGLANHWAPTS